MTRFLRGGVAALCLTMLAVSPAAAVRPTQEFVPVNEAGIQDEFLSDFCGFDVWFDATGHIVFRTFVDADGNAIREVHNFAVETTYYSENGSVVVHDVGPDRVWINEDGSVTVFVTGSVQSIQAMGEGRVYSDVGWIELHITFDAAGNPIVEVVGAAGQHSEEDRAEILCELLA